MIREAIANHTGIALPELPAQPPARAYGAVQMAQSAPLLRALPRLCPGDGIPALKPAPMEAYGQPCVLSPLLSTSPVIPQFPGNDPTREVPICAHVRAKYQQEDGHLPRGLHLCASSARWYNGRCNISQFLGSLCHIWGAVTCCAPASRQARRHRVPDNGVRQCAHWRRCAGLLGARTRLCAGTPSD